MNVYKKQISKAIKVNYKGITFFSQNFLNHFFSYRDKCLKNIIKNNNIENKINKNDLTYYWLKSQYLHLNDKKIINLKKCLVFYKKFEINCSLKKKYNSKNLKLTNKETHIESYIFLGLIITKLKHLNIYQKLSCILKILDKLLLNKNLIFLNKAQLIKLIIWEKKIINKLLNEK